MMIDATVLFVVCGVVTDAAAIIVGGGGIEALVLDAAPFVTEVDVLIVTVPVVVCDTVDVVASVDGLVLVVNGPLGFRLGIID